MYRIIGNDQREYGPVPAEEIRNWIASRRANGRTMVRLEDGTDWKPLSAHPEFSDALQAAWGNTGAAPGGLGSEYIRRQVMLDMGSCFRRGLALLKADGVLMIGSTALLVVIFLGINVVPFIGPFAMVALFGPLVAGWQLIFLKRSRGEPSQLSDLFWAFGPRFLPVFLSGMVYVLLCGAGFVLILPGLYLSVAWVFSLLLIVDKGLDFWAAMETSRRVVTASFFTLFMMCALLVLLSLAGLAALIVGGFVTLALANAVLVTAYEDIFSSRGTAAPPL